MKGILVAIEGIDGAGKSTLVNEIVSTCKEYNFNKLSGVGGYFITKELRSIEEKMNKYEELLLSEEVKNIAWMMDFYITGKKIEKMLERGENVIVDRYTLSAKVYAESTTSVNMDDYFSIYTLLPTPDVWIIVDVEPNIALERIYKRNKKIAPYENMEGLKAIMNKYYEVIEKENLNIIKINGNLDRQKTKIQTENVIKKFLADK